MIPAGALWKGFCAFSSWAAFSSISGFTMGAANMLNTIMHTAQDKRFASYFKKYQFILLTNFGTAFGMGILVIVFMIGQGFHWEPLVGLFGAFCGCIVSTRTMQYLVVREYPSYRKDPAEPH